MYVLVERFFMSVRHHVCVSGKFFFMSVRGHVCVSGKVFHVSEGSCMC
jgi:hypothetical protein